MEKDWDFILIAGASGGIGRALTKLLLEKTDAEIIAPMRPETLLRFRQEHSLLAQHERLSLVAVDFYHEQDLGKLSAHLEKRKVGHLDLIVNCIGHLHDNSSAPEKSLRDINLDSLLKSFQINACTLPLLISQLRPYLKRERPSCLVSLSAKVGSLTDNQLGGWYAYRASKAAHNMFLKTMAIEFKRTHPKLLMLAVHPGTTKTSLSLNYLANIQHQVYSPDETAEHLWSFIQKMGAENHGGFYHWDSTPIAW